MMPALSLVLPRFGRLLSAVFVLGFVTSGRLRSAPATLYTNTFDDASALNGLETSPGAAGGEVRVEAGRLLLRGAPFSYRGARVAIPLSTVLSRPGPFRLADLAAHRISWTFHLTYADGEAPAANCGVRIHLLSDGSPPDAAAGVSYSLRAGLHADDRVTFRRLTGPGHPNPSEGSPATTSATGGLRPAPRQGAVRVDYYPRSDVWDIALLQADIAPDPARIGRNASQMWHKDHTRFIEFERFTHVVFEAQNGGAVYLDNLGIATYATEADYVGPPYQQIVLPPLPDFTFGDALYTLPATSSAGLPVVWTVNYGPARIENGQLHLTGAGRVLLSGTQDNDEVYNPVSVTHFFEVAPRPFSIQLDELLQTYRGLPHPISVTTTPPGVPVQVTYAGNQEPPRHVGDYPVVVTSDSADYFGRAEGRLHIEPALLHVSPAPVSRLIGQPNPDPLPLNYEGLRGNDTDADIDLPPVASTRATPASPTGAYRIALRGGADPDYRFRLSPGTLIVTAYSGTYEALLTSPVASDGPPLGKLSITPSSTRPRFTGTLWLTGEKAPRALAGKLDDLDADGFLAATVFYSSQLPGESPGTQHRLHFDFDASRLRAHITRGADIIPYAASTEGAPLYRTLSRSSSPWRGLHTLLLRPPAPEPDTAESRPTAVGYAQGTITASSGALALRGRLPDGTVFSAGTRPDDLGRHRLLVRPHGSGRVNSLAGRLDLLPHPSLAHRHFIPSGTQALFWTKTPSPAARPDKLYPDGFASLRLDLALDPWLAPAPARRATAQSPAQPAVTLAGRLGLIDTPAAIDVIYPAIDFGPSAPDLAEALELDARGRISPVGADLTRWKMTVDPARGSLSGSFVLSYPAPPPTTKPVKSKKVTFTGVLRQPSEETDRLVGAAQFIWTDITTDDPSESAEILFMRPESPDGEIAPP